MWRWLLAAVIVAAAAAGIGSSVLNQRRVALHRANMKRLGLALHLYHDAHGSFPPAYLVDKAGRPAHSWRVLVLPYLGEKDLHGRYNFEQPWDGPGNAKLAGEMPAAFANPFGGPRGTTPYQALVGSQTMWPGPVATTIGYISDGTTNTIMLVESPTSVEWLRPADVALADWAGPSGGTPLWRRVGDKPAYLACMADGSARHVSVNTDRKVMYAYATAAGGSRHPGLNGKALPGEEPTIEFPPDLRPRQLPTTDVAPIADIPLAPGRNAAWCAVFPLAWAELKRQSYPVNRLDANATIKALEARPFPPGDLSPGSYFAMASANAEGDIARAFAARFPDAGFAPLPAEARSIGWYAFASLQKTLPFAVAFQTPDKPLRFAWSGGKSDVRCFGISGEPDPAGGTGAKWLEQVAIAHYAGPTDVVAILKATTGDQIVLSLLEPAATLRATWDKVAARIKAGKRVGPMVDGDTILVPKIRLATISQFDDFRRVDGGAEVYACQGIRFVLNEAGAKLEAFAEILDADDLGDAQVAAGPKRLRFDRPFLLALRERPDAEPYLLLWVGDADLLEAAP